MKRKTSEAIPEWRRQLPAINGVAPLGRARLCARFRMIPTNPDSERLQAEFYEWGLKSGLYSEKTARDLAHTRMGHLVYWIAPKAPIPVLWAVGIFNLWVIAVDDALAEKCQPLDELAQASEEVMRHGKTDLTHTPAVTFFLELRQKLAELGGEGLYPQIADQLVVSFAAWKKEQQYLQDDQLPGLMDYLQLRVGNPCLYGPMLVQRCEKGLLHPDKVFSSRLDRICQMVNVLVSLNGDIVGYRRDLEESFFRSTSYRYSRSSSMSTFLPHIS